MNNVLSNFFDLWCKVEFDQLGENDKNIIIKIYENKTEYLKEYLRGYLQNITDERIINALFFVTVRFSKTTEIIKLLANNYGPEAMDQRTKKNNTLLMCSAENDNVNILICLINEFNMDVNHINNKGYNCLVYACGRNNNEQIIKYLTDECGMDINFKDKHNYYCLMRACQFSNIHIIKYLIEIYHMDIHCTDDKNRSCLTYACAYNYPDVIKYLINEHGMDINKKINADNHRLNFLHVACRNNNNIDTIKFLVEECKLEIDKLCFIVAADQNIIVMKYLITKYSVSPEYTDFKKSFLLKTAVKNLEVVKFLVEECEFDVGQNDVHGKNALIRSCISSPCLDVIKYFVNLLNNKINDVNDQDKNCLMLACQNNPNLEIIKYLIEVCGMDPNKCNGRNNNCISVACYGNTNFEVVKYLIEDRGMDVHHKNVSNRGYLTLAFMNKHKYIDVISYLLKHLTIYDLDLSLQSGNHHIKINKLINTIDFFATGYKRKELNELLDVIYYHYYTHINIQILECVRSKNPLLFNVWIASDYGISDPLKSKFVDFIDNVDKYLSKVECYNMDLHATSFEINSDNKTYDNNEIFEVTVDLNPDLDPDYSLPNDILFKNNGEPFYGHKKRVYGSIPVFECIVESADFNEPVDLNLDVPVYMMNLYIDSTYTQKFNINKIKPYDFIKFLKLIDQYPTKFLSIDRIEMHIIKYIDNEKNIIDIDMDYLIGMIKKYELRIMYIWMHNRKYVN